MHRAVEGDDWSEVIDRQTSEAVAGPALETAQLAQGAQILHAAGV